jgi:crossover junction endodeoxyribonuclease RusA
VIGMENVTPEQLVSGEPFSTTFRFDWKKAPLSLNDRMHHMQKANITKRLRTDMHAMARHIPDLGRCEVRLVWFVNTKARRDDENPVPTLKALCDGLVDAEIVEDDTAEFMVKHMPQIRYIPKSVDVAHFEFTVTQIGAAA